MTQGSLRREARGAQALRRGPLQDGLGKRRGPLQDGLGKRSRDSWRRESHAGSPGARRDACSGSRSQGRPSLGR